MALGGGLTNVPLGHRVAGTVKSSGLSLLAYYRTENNRIRTRLGSRCTYRQSEKVGQSFLQSSKGKALSNLGYTSCLVYQPTKWFDLLV